LYKDGVPTVPHQVPWDLSFEDRMALLTRGSPRAAYFYSVPDTSTFRYRAYNVAQALQPGAAAGGPSAAWFTDRDLDRMERVLNACDVLVLCRNSLYTDGIARLAAKARARNRRILFDVDDLVFDPSYAHLLVDTLGLDTQNPEVWNYWFGYIGRVGATFALCDGALVTNDYLAGHAEAWSGKPARILPNFLNAEQQEISDRIWQAKERQGWRRDGRMHLAYFSGSPSHNRDFALVSSAIAEILDTDPTIWLRVVGFLEPGSELDRHASRIEALPLQDFINLQREIGSIEINLVPLQQNPFTHSKSDLKWFEAAIVGALTVASPTRAYREIIEPGRNGWLAEAYSWKTTLLEIVRHFHDWREDVAPRARAEALERFGWDRQAAAIEAALFGGW
jgi:glycosyltransferase involved in cell wall biosynthesis